MDQILRWGIMGTGNIAGQFAQGIALGSTRTHLQAVGSRQSASAATFAHQHHIPNTHGSYEALLADPQVDAIYLSLPNSMHHAWTLASLRAGKHVLCEKPIATDASQCQEMFDVAEKLGLVLVEAFMYRSHPLIQSVIDAVDRGKIGQLRMIRTSFCYLTNRIEDNIRFNADLAGGGLMDIGCYCINLSRCLAKQEPTQVHALADLHENKVDQTAVGSMLFGDNLLASFTCGMSVQIDNTAYLGGSLGYIEIPIPWKPPVPTSVYHLKQAVPPKQDKRGAVSVPHEQIIKVHCDKPLYACEADDFAWVVWGQASPRITRQDSLGNMQVLDTMRQQIGLAF